MLCADRNPKQRFDVAWGPRASCNNHRIEPGGEEASGQRALLGCPSPSPALWIRKSARSRCRKTTVMSKQPRQEID